MQSWFYPWSDSWHSVGYFTVWYHHWSQTVHQKFIILPKDTLIYGQQKLGIEPMILWLMDDMLPLETWNLKLETWVCLAMAYLAACEYATKLYIRWKHG